MFKHILFSLVVLNFLFSCRQPESRFSGVYFGGDSSSVLVLCGEVPAKKFWLVTDTAKQIERETAKLELFPYQPVFVKLDADTLGFNGDSKTAGMLRVRFVSAVSAEVPDSCHTVLSGSDYQLTAGGFEPGWFLKIDSTGIFFVNNYGADTLIYSSGDLYEAGRRKIIVTDEKKEEHPVFLVSVLPALTYDPAGKLHPYAVTIKMGKERRTGWGD